MCNGKKNVCIVVLNYNNYMDTIECIKSIQKIDYHDYKIIVVDNNSKNNSVSELQKEFSDSIIMIKSDINLGYAGGNNLGLEYALKYGFEYACVLNNDTVVSRDFLTKCVEHLENNHDVAFVAPVVMEYSEEIVQSCGGIVIPKKGSTMPINKGMTIEELPAEVECDYISGACLVFSTRFMKKHGLIPENYFLFYEETEWCYQAKKNGYKNVCITSSYIRHKGSVSINQVEGLSAYMMARNRVVFYRRNINSGVKYLLFLFYITIETFYCMIKFDRKYINCFKAYWDGVTNKVSKRYPFVIINE